MDCKLEQQVKLVINFNGLVTGFDVIDTSISGNSNASESYLRSHNYIVTLGTAVSSTPTIGITGTIDGTPTRVTTVRVPGTSGSTDEWLLSFDRPISGLQISNLTISGNTITGLQFTGGAYRLGINNPTNTSGTLSVNVRQGAVRPLGSNIAGPSQSESSGSYAFDTTGLRTPRVTISSGSFDPTVRPGAANGTVYFQTYWTNATSTQLDMLASADITVNGITATASVNTRMGTTIPISVPMPANTNSDMSITIGANAIGSNTNIRTTSSCLFVDNRDLTDIPTARFTLPNGTQISDTSDILVDWGQDVTDFRDGDISVTGGGTLVGVLANRWVYLLTGPATIGIGDITNVPSDNRVTGIHQHSGGLNRWIITFGVATATAPPIMIRGATIRGQGTSYGQNYTIRITNPTSGTGTINATVNAEAVDAVDDLVQGPASPQNSGSYAYNRDIVPRITNIDIPDRLTEYDDPDNLDDTNAIIIDFNTPVKGVSSDAFLLEGMDGVSIANANIFYDNTDPEPTDSPDAADRDTQIVDAMGDLIDPQTPKRYWKIRLTVPVAIPQGTLKVYLADNTINNDP